MNTLGALGEWVWGECLAGCRQGCCLCFFFGVCGLCFVACGFGGDGGVCVFVVWGYVCMYVPADICTIIATGIGINNSKLRAGMAFKQALSILSRVSKSGAAMCPIVAFAPVVGSGLRGAALCESWKSLLYPSESQQEL